MTDHADQRIEWMVTWLPQVPEEDRSILAESFGTAYSRLWWKKLTVSIEEIKGELGVKFSKSDEKHIESHADAKYRKTIDYSDFKETKEFKLY